MAAHVDAKPGRDFKPLSEADIALTNRYAAGEGLLQWLSVNGVPAVCAWLQRGRRCTRCLTNCTISVQIHRYLTLAQGPTPTR